MCHRDLGSQPLGLMVINLAGDFKVLGGVGSKSKSTAQCVPMGWSEKLDGQMWGLSCCDRGSQL